MVGIGGGVARRFGVYPVQEPGAQIPSSHQSTIFGLPELGRTYPELRSAHQVRALFGIDSKENSRGTFPILSRDHYF